MFYSANCDHCEAMLPIINELFQDEGIEITLSEVNQKDKQSIEMYEKYDQGKCGGVPFFVNAETGATLCGEVSKKELREWAERK